MTQELHFRNTPDSLDIVTTLVNRGAILGGAHYAILFCSGHRRMTQLLCDSAIGALMHERYDCVRELADEAMRQLMLDTVGLEGDAATREQDLIG